MQILQHGDGNKRTMVSANNSKNTTCIVGGEGGACYKWIGVRLFLDSDEWLVR